MRSCGFVDVAPAAHRGACRGLFELPTAHPFDHKLHSNLLCSMKRSQKPENQTLKLQSTRATPGSVTFVGTSVTMPESPVTFAGIHIAPLGPEPLAEPALDGVVLLQRRAQQSLR